jgi:DNA-binding NarL/FixJ family response regulator
MSTAAKVLVVDDEPSARQTASALLLPEGYDLRLASGGGEALALLDEAPVDLVICDVMMPAIDGFAVCRAIKAHLEWQFVPVILLTALGEREDVVRGLEAGADQFVSKPVEGAVLRARARAMLRVRSRYAVLRQLRAQAPPPDHRGQLVAQANLTAREREVLDLLLLGRTHQDIAEVLGISERTSKFHQANLLAKLGAESRLDLMRLFL